MLIVHVGSQTASASLTSNRPPYSSMERWRGRTVQMSGNSINYSATKTMWIWRQNWKSGSSFTTFTDHMVHSTEKPSVLVCGNDIIAHGAIYACQKSGLKIPEDISIIGIGDFRGSADMEPALTTLRLPARRIGEKAADTLCSGVLETAFGQQKGILMSTKLQERGSVKDLNAHLHHLD